MLKLNDQNFKSDVLQSKTAVLVDFWAPWCGPCQAAMLALESLEKEEKIAGKIKIGKLNVDENPQTTAKYGIMSIPTVIIFEKGKEVARKVGAERKEEYKQLLEVRGEKCDAGY